VIGRGTTPDPLRIVRPELPGQPEVLGQDVSLTSPRNALGPALWMKVYYNRICSGRSDSLDDALMQVAGGDMKIGPLLLRRHLELYVSAGKSGVHRIAGRGTFKF
jgi:hypothetical protein